MPTTCAPTRAGDEPATKVHAVRWPESNPAPFSLQFDALTIEPEWLGMVTLLEVMQLVSGETELWPESMLSITKPGSLFGEGTVTLLKNQSIRLLLQSFRKSFFLISSYVSSQLS